MEINELTELITKYRKLSAKLFSEEFEKALEYEEFADWIEENIETLGEEFDEKEVWEVYKESQDTDQYWDMFYPNREDEDDYEIPEWD